ncbi:hypothetical protein [Tychonema sp. LEGE 06208]|nr:hypothetical protein [Tychonema sp. LEGE 06208]
MIYTERKSPIELGIILGWIFPDRVFEDICFESRSVQVEALLLT